MPNPKWLVIAKNEFRVTTSPIRSLRRYYPLMLAGLFGAWVFYLAPMLVRSLMSDFEGLIVSEIAVAVFEIILFMFSVFLTIIPVSNALKEEGIGQIELMLKAPVRPGDVLVGEFVGKTPLYAIFAIVFAGLFTALLTPLGLNYLQTTLIIFMAFITCLGSFWIGTVIAAVARTTIGRTAKGKDIGKAMSFILILPLVAVMYMMMNGNLFVLLADPGTNGLVKTVLGLFPSSWAAEVIVAFALNPSNIGAVSTLTLTRVGGMIVFMATALAVGWMVADRAFSLEPTELGVTVVGADGAFYQTVRLLGGGGSFGSLLVSTFKDYSRRLENLSQMGYVVGLLVIMNFTFVDDASGAQMIGMLMATLMSLFFCAEATIRGKETLFIFRKTPSGVSRFMKAKVLQAWLIVIPLIFAIWGFSALRFNLAFSAPFLMEMGGALLVAMANALMALGLSFTNPAYSQKSPAYMINLQVGVFLVMGTLIIPDLVFHMPWLHLPLAWAVGLVLFFLGYRKMSSME
ncbi:MAG TPA: hypothetical protein VM050_01435 [Patescibacteria group bacterium]|nr:hypothetical protein [Patescibacteria group bacterium]